MQKGDVSMNREQREQIWISLGLQGALELMDASCSLCERLTEECVENPAVKDALIRTIAAEIIRNRQPV
jgi:hypothetical protein